MNKPSKPRGVNPKDARIDKWNTEEDIPLDDVDLCKEAVLTHLMHTNTPFASPSFSPCGERQDPTRWN